MPIRPRRTKGREAFGKRVAYARSQKGWTLADLGREVGVSGTCIWNWEEGNTHPRPASFARLTKALGLSTEHLLQGQDAAEAAALNDDRSAADAPQSLADLISRSREAIAQIAGLPSSNVRIILDYGD